MRRLLALVLILFTLLVLPSAQAIPPTNYRIGGIVVDSLTGQPLSLAEVTLAPVTALDDVRTFLTATDGGFLFASLAPGKYRLMASRRGYAVQGFNQHESFMTAIAACPGQDSEHLRFRLSPSSVLTGVAYDQWNDPLRDAEVILFQQSWPAGSRSLHQLDRTTTNDLGHYRFAHLLPGTYAVAVLARPWWGDFGSQSLDVSSISAQLSRPSDRESLQFAEGLRAVLERGASVAPNPALDLVYPITYFPSANALSEAAEISLQPGATETADFTLHPVPSIHLHVRVAATAPAAVPVNVQTNDADGEENVTVQSEPNTDVEVYSNLSGENSNPIQATRTEISPGLFELSGIPPGDVTVTVSGSQGQTESSRTQSLQLAANAEIDLTPHGTLVDVSGVVLIQQDAPDPQTDTAEEDSSSMSFMLELRSRKTGESFKANISPKGEFSLAGSALPPGTYEVGLSGNLIIQVTSLEATGATVSHRTIEIPGGQPVKLTIHTAEAKSSLTGVALKDGRPFAGAMILLVPQGADQNPALFHRDQSDSDGTFALAPLFPGRYTLLALENGWDLEWSNPSVLFNYLPNGLPVEIKPNAAANFNAKVQ